jgi:hypothetical protein
MRYQKIKKRKKKRDLVFKDGFKSLEYCYLYIRSHCFEDRECITFDKNGFIGFAGEMYRKNTAPIIRGFIKWCYWMKEYENDSQNTIHDSFG